MTLLTPSYKVFVQTSVPTAHNLAYICKKKNTFGTDKNARQGNKSFSSPESESETYFVAEKKFILLLVMMGNSLEQHRASIGAFNASSKRGRWVFSSRSSNLTFPIAAPIHFQLLLFGVLSLVNRHLLLSTALMIGFLVSIILSLGNGRGCLFWTQKCHSFSGRDQGSDWR